MGIIAPFVRYNPLDNLIFFNNIRHILTGSYFKPFGLKIVGYARDVARQIVTAQMLLPDEQKIDAESLGFLADESGLIHVGGKYLGIHLKAGKNIFGFINQGLGLGEGHELGEIGFAKPWNKIKFSI